MYFLLQVYHNMPNHVNLKFVYEKITNSNYIFLYVYVKMCLIVLYGL